MFLLFFKLLSSGEEKILWIKVRNEEKMIFLVNI